VWSFFAFGLRLVPKKLTNEKKIGTNRAEISIFLRGGLSQGPTAQPKKV
jgi:hypothetical protein